MPVRNSRIERTINLRGRSSVFLIQLITLAWIFCFDNQLLNANVAPLKIPDKFELDQETGRYVFMDGKKKITTTLVPEIQSSLTRYIGRHGKDISAVVLLEVESGKVLAMAQGKSPENWGSKLHSALYPGFPAASLFKTIGAAAALDIGGVSPDTSIGLSGGCAKVRPGPRWLKPTPADKKFGMSLRRAYAKSCNGFFAKLLVERIGLGALLKYAGSFHWGKTLPADFQIPTSPMLAPDPTSSNTQTVGKFAAGFGKVGISAVHAAWQMLVIAKDGKNFPLRLIDDDERGQKQPKNYEAERVLDLKTAKDLRYLMDRTTINGTAGFAFRKNPYRRFRHLVGGKTGTLNGENPKGLTTWFNGLMPIKKPEIVVAAVVVSGDRWIIKGSNLAAEALRIWRSHKKTRLKLLRWVAINLEVPAPSD